MELANWDDDDETPELTASNDHLNDDVIFEFAQDDRPMSAIGGSSVNDATLEPVPPGWRDLTGDRGVLLKEDIHPPESSHSNTSELQTPQAGAAQPSEQLPFVELHYDGYVHQSGDKFDSSRDQNYPMIVQLDIPPTGKSVLIPGLEIALRHLRAGQTAEARIKSQYAYHDKGEHDIPPHSDLRFHLQIIDVRATHRPEVIVDESEKDLSRLELVRQQRQVAQQRREEELASKQAEKQRKADRAAALREKLANKNAPGKKKGGKKKK